MAKSIHYIIAGGTFSHIRPHLAIAAPAFGKVGMDLEPYLQSSLDATDPGGEDVPEPVVRLVLTRMAQGGWARDPRDEALLRAAGLADLVTEDDMAQLVDYLVAQPETRGIIMAAANVDFYCHSLRSVTDEAGEGYWNTLIGKEYPRLSSSVGQYDLRMLATPKIVPTIRAARKDIYAVGFKTTSGATRDEQYLAGLNLLKTSSLNLVLANDLVTRLCMVITPEQATYHETTDRQEALEGLARIYASRCRGTFTRSTVVPGELVPWNSPEIPDVLRTVVNHCIARGAYKPFNGSTVGHFAVRLRDPADPTHPNIRMLTTRRKTDYNKLAEPGEGLVLVESTGPESVVAHGAKPSVGGMSQRAIFGSMDVDCIVHFHCPTKPGHRANVVQQWPNECGSMQCGAATRDGLRYWGDKVYAVMLENHGPNIVFPADAHPDCVIRFIEDNFDLTGRTDHVGA